ncbi:MAG: hypothetical protein H6585_10725 [Flavobacteriales bacterium]|nr:hypothetical protein [Flavobacteriales bacterium]MCB9448806.1 hypothetical protein [Flavobacteriales bacterium]
MGILSGMFKTRKPRQFNYEPRYYDERKERVEKTIRVAEREAASAQEKSTQTTPPPRLSDQRFSFEAHASRQSQLANRRLIIILALLVLIVYLYLKL